MKALIRRTLSLRLGLAFLVVSLAAVALVAVLVGTAAPTEFERFLLDQGRRNYTAVATGYYLDNGTWAGVERALAQMGLVMQPPPLGVPDAHVGPVAHRPPPMILVDADGVVLVGGVFFGVGSVVDLAQMEQTLPIEVNGQIVGYVVGTGYGAEPDDLTAAYLGRINRMLVIAASIAGTASLLLGLFLARTISRPVRALTVASQAMAQGDLGQVVEVQSDDELGELAIAFNHMNQDLARAAQVRRQMTADIAHELRTPLTVMAGYTEAMRDGVLDPTPERFGMMYDETMHLQRLVGDLRTLSLAEAGEIMLSVQPIGAAALLERVAATFAYQAEQREIALRVEAGDTVGSIRVDVERTAQVLGNLVTNAMRYTPQGGVITLMARHQGDSVALIVTDTGQGMDAAILPHVFERFYRGDPSRTEGNGQSGLGLAIAKALVESQGGTVSAHSDGPGRGSTFTVWFPTGA